MKRFTTRFTTIALLVATLLQPSSVVNAQTDGARVLTGSAQPPLPYNILPQPGFENRTTGWSVTSGTFTTTQTTANVARGRFSSSWTVPASTASGIIMQSEAITVPPGLMGRQCVAAILSKGNAATNGTMTLDAYDGTTSYGARAIIDSSLYTRTTTTVFTCPTSGTLRLRVRTTATSPATPAQVFFDEAYLGENSAVGSSGASGGYDVTPTTSVTNATTLTFVPSTRGLVYVQGSGGAVTVDGTTPLTAGTVNGQELVLIGRDASNTVTIANSGNVVQHGSITLGLNTEIAYVWDSVNSKWLETFRTDPNGTIAIANGGTGQTTANAGFNALSPNTTKGDITVRNGTVNARLPVGADRSALVADSAQALGVKYIQPAGLVGMAIITGGAPTRSSATYGSLATASSMTGPTVLLQGPIATIATTDSDLPKFPVTNAPIGTYLVTMSFAATQSNSDYMCFAISDGTDIRGKTCTAPGVNVYVPFHITAAFSYSSVATQTFELVAAALTGTVTLINTPAIGGLNATINYMPN